MKKNLYTLLILAAVAFMLTACTVEREPVFNPENAVPSVLDPVTDYELSDSVDVFAELTFRPSHIRPMWIWPVTVSRHRSLSER